MFDQIGIFCELGHQLEGIFSGFHAALIPLSVKAKWCAIAFRENTGHQSFTRHSRPMHK
jgi:hypothetical protein